MPIPTDENNLERISAKDIIYETMKKWIIEGQMKPLEKIVDMEVAAYFNVSRTPVREALQLLEKQKLIKSFPGKTTIVAEIEMENIEQWYLPMLILQQFAVELAIERITEEDLAHLIELNMNFAAEGNAHNNVMNMLNADKAFHDFILEVADNEYIIDFCETLWIHIQRLEYSFFKETDSLEESIYDHEKIIKSFEMKDGLTASIAMKNNWDRTVLQIQNLKMLNKI